MIRVERGSIIMLKESYYHDTSRPVTDLTLNEILRKTCEKNEENWVTWANPYEKLTHKELYEQVNTLAKGLLALGLKRGDAFCSFGSQGSDSVLLFLACSCLGLKYTANYLYSPISKVISMMLKKINPTAILVGDCTSGKEQEHVCTEFTKVIAEFQKAGAHSGTHIIYDRKAEANPKCTTAEEWKSFSSVMQMGRETVTNEALQAAKSEVTNEDPFMYLCSSGSTGDPKIITISQRTFANGIANSQAKEQQPMIAGSSDISEGVIHPILVVFHCLGNSLNLVLFPANNSPDETEVIKEILSTVDKYRVNLLLHRLDYIIKIVNNPSYKTEYDISCLVGFVIGGCLSSLEFKEKLMQFAPFSMDVYGGTEFMHSLDGVPLNMLPPTKLNTVGRGNPNVELKVIDEEGVTVPVNTKGEMCVRGWPLFLNYKDQPELTAKAMDKDGWYHTGDMVSMDEDGFIYVYGRISTAQRWKVDSKVIYSISIESVLISHPSIRSCAVIGTDNGKGHDLNYVIEPAPGSGLSVAEVKEFAEKKMYNSLEWPTRVFLYSYEELPKTKLAIPKLDRKSLTEQIIQRVETDPLDGKV